MIESGNEKILIIAPHADDEVLGCGGLIEKACRYKNKVKVVIGTVGNTHFHHTDTVIPAETRKQEFTEAMNALGCQDIDVLYDDKETWMDTIPQKELISKIDFLLADFKPSMVFIPYPSFHQDHQALFKACMAGLRPNPDRHYKLIAMFEYPLIVWQYPRISDVGELYLDISETIERKVEALIKHKSQLRISQHMISPETLKNWAEKRGLEIGVKYAEKYHLLKAKI